MLNAGCPNIVHVVPYPILADFDARFPCGLPEAIPIHLALTGGQGESGVVVRSGLVVGEPDQDGLGDVLPSVVEHEGVSAVGELLQFGDGCGMAVLLEA